MTLSTEQFLKDVKDHVMEVIREDGTYRHIRFRRPGTMCLHFDLVTWPGYLAYVGDMGSFVFTRLQDMFQFFRTERPDPFAYIDRRYWSEKLVAVDGQRRHGSATEFSPERFRQVINEYRVSWIREAKEFNSLTKEQRRELWEAVDNEVLTCLDEGEHAVYARANDFSWSVGRFLPGNYPTYSFEDLWDHDFHDYTHCFNWCCLALAWGIRQYDQQREKSHAPTP